MYRSPTIQYPAGRIELKDDVTGLALSPRGSLLAALHHKCLQIWKLGGKTVELLTLRELVAKPTCVIWPKEGLFVYGTDLGEVVVCKFCPKKRTVFGEKMRLRPTAPVSLLAASPCLTLLAAVLGNRRIALLTLTGTDEWDVWQTLPSPGRLELEGTVADTVITSVAWSPSGEYHLAVSYRHHGVQIWDAKSRTVVWKVERLGHLSGIHSPDGALFASENGDGRFDIYDIWKQRRILTLSDSAYDIAPFSTSNTTRLGGFLEGGALFLGSGRGKVNLWSICGSSITQVMQLDPHGDQRICLLSVTSRERNGGMSTVKVAAATSDRFIHFWEAGVSIDHTAIASQSQVLVQDRGVHGTHERAWGGGWSSFPLLSMAITSETDPWPILTIGIFIFTLALTSMY